MEHLFGQALAHLVLELAACRQETGEALLLRHGEQAAFVQQQAHGGAYWAAGGLHHVLNAEIQPAGAFAPGRGDQTQAQAVEQQPGRRPGLPQQPLHASVGGSPRQADVRRDAFGLRRAPVR